MCVELATYPQVSVCYIAEKVVILWSVGSVFNVECLSTILGHTTLSRTATYQVLVVDSYTNWAEQSITVQLFLWMECVQAAMCTFLLQNVSKVFLAACYKYDNIV